VNATGSREPRTALEDENRRLKRMFADLSMQADLLKEALGKK
jgi:putative transposase